MYNRSFILCTATRVLNGNMIVIHRFQKEDMERLLHALEIPAYYECVQRTKSTGMEALVILLRRLVYPNRWRDLVPVIGRDEVLFSTK